MAGGCLRACWMRCRSRGHSSGSSIWTGRDPRQRRRRLHCRRPRHLPLRRSRQQNVQPTLPPSGRQARRRPVFLPTSRRRSPRRSGTRLRHLRRRRTHQRQRTRTNQRSALRPNQAIRPLPSQATSLRPPRLLNLRRAGPIPRRSTLQLLRVPRRRYQVRQRRRRNARRSRRRMRRIRRPSRSSRPTIRHGPRFRSRPPGPCQSPLMCRRRRRCRPRQ